VHAVVELADDGLAGHADHRVQRASHADVGLVGRTVLQDAGVGGGHVGVRAQQGADPAVEKKAHGLLFGRGLGVEIDQDRGHLVLLQEIVDGGEGVVDRGLHEHPPLQADDQDRVSAGGTVDHGAVPRGRGVVVQGPENALFRLQQLQGFLLVPDMVAPGEHVDASLKQLVGGALDDAQAPGRVLAVGDDHVRGELGPDQGQNGLDEAAAAAADDVADQDQPHSLTWHTRSPGPRG
jgi:hypothetical protein